MTMCFLASVSFSSFGVLLDFRVLPCGAMVEMQRHYPPLSRRSLSGSRTRWSADCSRCRQTSSMPMRMTTSPRCKYMVLADFIAHVLAIPNRPVVCDHGFGEHVLVHRCTRAQLYRGLAPRSRPRFCAVCDIVCCALQSPGHQSLNVTGARVRGPVARRLISRRRYPAIHVPRRHRHPCG